MEDIYIDIRTQNKWIQKYFDTDFVSISQLLSCIEDLDTEIEIAKEKYEDLERDIEENYKWVGSGEPDWHDIQDHRPSWWVD